MLVVHALPSVLDCLIISGSRTSLGKRVYIPRVSLAPKLPDLPFILRRRQFPVKLAWAITINKSQGQSLLRVGVHLPIPFSATDSFTLLCLELEAPLIFASSWQMGKTKGFSKQVKALRQVCTRIMSSGQKRFCLLISMLVGPRRTEIAGYSLRPVSFYRFADEMFF